MIKIFLLCNNNHLRIIDINDKYITEFENTTMMCHDVINGKCCNSKFIKYKFHNASLQLVSGAEFINNVLYSESTWNFQ